MMFKVTECFLLNGVSSINVKEFCLQGKMFPFQVQSFLG